MTKVFLVVQNGGNLSKTQVKEQALKELKARFDEDGQPCVCVVFDKDNKGIYLGSVNESGAKIEGFISGNSKNLKNGEIYADFDEDNHTLFMDIATLDIEDK